MPQPDEDPSQPTWLVITRTRAYTHVLIKALRSSSAVRTVKWGWMPALILRDGGRIVFLRNNMDDLRFYLRGMQLHGVYTDIDGWDKDYDLQICLATSPLENQFMPISDLFTTLKVTHL